MMHIDKRSSKYTKWFRRYFYVNSVKFILYPILFFALYFKSNRLDLTLYCLGFIVIGFWVFNYRSLSKYFIQFIEVVDHEVIIEYWKWNSLIIERIPIVFLEVSFKEEAKFNGSSFLVLKWQTAENSFKIWQYTCGWSKEELLAVLKNLNYSAEDSEIKKAT